MNLGQSGNVIAKNLMALQPLAVQFVKNGDVI